MKLTPVQIVQRSMVLSARVTRAQARIEEMKAVNDHRKVLLLAPEYTDFQCVIVDEKITEQDIQKLFETGE